MSSCSVNDADKLLIQDSAGVFYIVNVNKISLDTQEALFSDTEPHSPDEKESQVSDMFKTYIYYKNIKYTLDTFDQEYHMLPWVQS